MDENKLDLHAMLLQAVRDGGHNTPEARDIEEAVGFEFNGVAGELCGDAENPDLLFVTDRCPGDTEDSRVLHALSALTGIDLTDPYDQDCDYAGTETTFTVGRYHRPSIEPTSRQRNNARMARMLMLAVAGTLENSRMAPLAVLVREEALAIAASLDDLLEMMASEDRPQE